LAQVSFIGVPRQTDFSLDLPALLAAIEQHRPALVFLANPNNPTGSWIPEEQIVSIIEAMAGIGCVVVDEAYRPFAPGSMMARLPEFANLIVMRTVSKLGLAGIRLGYMSASAELLAEFDKVRPPYNINVLTEAAMEFLLDHAAVFDEQARQIRAERQALISYFQQQPGVHVFPSEANFVLIKVPDADQIFNKLIEHKILVKNVSKMHHLLTNCLRITVGTPAENQLLIKAFQ
jgi:histidinol-phosphate aminotransferase